MSEGLEALLRWTHVVAGIMWIGHLWFFNFVNGPFQGKIDGPTKKIVNPELMPRALYWFRWGAAWTWVTGVLLLLMVFYMNKAAISNPLAGVGPAAYLMLLVTLLAAAAYDAVFKSGLGKDVRTGTAVCYVGLVVIVLLFTYVGDFSYRGVAIHVGGLFGTTMAYNVWMRIWPAQKQIITAVKNGTPPPADLVAIAGARSRHNTFMSVPLVWMMINSHTTVPFASWGPSGMVGILGFVLLGWWITSLLYKKAATVPGF